MASGEIGWMVTPRRSVSGIPGQSQTADAFASRSLGRVDTRQGVRTIDMICIEDPGECRAKENRRRH